MNEIWKDIKGYEGLYQVSNLGRIKSFLKNKQGQVLNCSPNTKGYLQFRLRKNGVSKVTRVHRIVAETFIDNPNNYTQVNHKDENKLNNNINNLEWCDCIYNINYGTRNERRTKTISKPVIQYDLNMKMIQEFNSIKEAANITGFNNRSISKCCKGRLKTYKKYIWKYKGE